MSSDSLSTSETLEQTKREIHRLIGEIQNLAVDLEPAEYFAEFLPRVIRGLGAVSGVVWVASGDGGLRPAFHVNVGQALLGSEGEEGERHQRLLQKVYESGEAGLALPQSENVEAGTGNPTDYLLVVAPLRSGDRVEGLVEVFQRPHTSPSVQRGYQRFLQEMCRHSERWFSARQRSHVEKQLSVLAGQDELVQAVHASLDRRLTACTIANEARRFIDCDRVSVTLCKGRKCTIEAVSGQDRVEKRSDVVTSLRRLADAVVATGESFWFDDTTESAPPQIKEVLEAYVDLSLVKGVGVVPLRKPPPPTEPSERTNETDDVAEDTGEIIGALIVEQIEHVRPPSALKPYVDVVRSHGSRALANALQYHGLFLMPVWQTLGRTKLLFRGRALPKTVVVLGVATIILLSLLLVPADFNLKAEGSLEPVQRSDFYVTVKGVVKDVHVTSGQVVKPGDLLVTLESHEITQELIDVEGELDNILEREKESTLRLLTDERLPLQERMSPEERDRVWAELSSIAVDKANLQKQLAEVLERASRLRITSTMAGQVATWDIEERLKGRPVEEGQLLVTVFDPDGGWQLELKLPDKRMGHLTEAQLKLDEGDQLPVTYMLSSEPGVTRDGHLEHIQPVAEVDEEKGHSLRLRVAIDADDADKPILDPRPGATVTGQVHCGRRSLGFVWFHDVGETVAKKWFEWF